MATKTKHFVVNAICGLVYGRDRRRYVRTVLNGNVIRNVRFVRANLGTRINRIRIRTGYRGLNIVIIANDKWAFKFPVAVPNATETARREKRIVDALTRFCPVKVPRIELLEMPNDDGTTTTVRKYEFVRGVTVRDMPVKTALANINKLAPQMAAAVYAISCADPTEIRDLKPTPRARAGYMRGWSQGDICDNFMIDPKTMKIIAYIDWEDAAFTDMTPMFRNNRKTPNKEIMAAVAHEYDKLWRHDHGDKK